MGEIHRSRYSRRTAWIHWFSSILIFLLIFSGITMEKMNVSIDKYTIYLVHFITGTIVFILTIIRIIAIATDGSPRPLYPKNSVHYKFMRFVHLAFYVVLIWMCISGLVSLFTEGIYLSVFSGNSQELIEITSDGLHPIMLSHHIIAKLVFILLIFHVGGFILHFIRKKENVLKRIWFK